MKHHEIMQALSAAPVQEAFGGEVSADQLARVLLKQGELVLRQAELDPVDTEVRSVKFVYCRPEDMTEEELKYVDAETFKIVGVRVFVARPEGLYRLAGDFTPAGEGVEGEFKAPVLQKSRPELPNWSWRDVFERTGVTMSPEFARFAELAAKDGGVRRAMKPANALMEVESFLRPDQLPFLRTTAGDYLVLRFDGKTGAPVDYALVIHDDFVTYPMGESLAAALRYLGATEVESWVGNADEIAGATSGYFETVSAALDLMYEWNHWKFKLDQGSSANSEELCREWLDKWEALDVSVLRKNARCQTMTAFAAARLGATQRAVDAAVAALRLPARDGDWRRHAFLLLDELGAEVPADLKTLRDCLRSSSEIPEVLQAFEVAAKARTEKGDHEGAYELLMRASYDYDGGVEQQLLPPLLEAARAAGYGPVAEVLATRLQFPL